MATISPLRRRMTDNMTIRSRRERKKIEMLFAHLKRILRTWTASG